MSLRKDYYKILGIDKGAGDRDIKRAYRDMAKQFHPDKVGWGQGTLVGMMQARILNPYRYN